MRSVTEHQIQPQYPPFLIFLMLDPEVVVNRRGKPSYPRSVKASMGLKLQRGLKAVPQLVRVPRPVTDAALCSLVVASDVDGGEVVEPRRSISTTGSHKTVLQMGHDALADADVMLQPELEAGGDVDQHTIRDTAAPRWNSDRKGLGSPAAGDSGSPATGNSGKGATVALGGGTTAAREGGASGLVGDGGGTDHEGAPYID
jgi:hypothetical protein